MVTETDQTGAGPLTKAEEHLEQLKKKVWELRREHIATVMAYENFLVFQNSKMVFMAQHIENLEKGLSNSKEVGLTIVGADGQVKH